MNHMEEEPMCPQHLKSLIVPVSHPLDIFYTPLQINSNK